MSDRVRLDHIALDRPPIAKVIAMHTSTSNRPYIIAIIILALALIAVTTYTALNRPAAAAPPGAIGSTGAGAPPAYYTNQQPNQNRSDRSARVPLGRDRYPASAGLQSGSEQRTATANAHPSTASAPSTQSTTSTPSIADERPAILNYLAGLKQIEHDKQLALTRQNAILTTEVQQARRENEQGDPPSADTKRNLNETTQELIKLLAAIQSRTAALIVPAAAADLHHKYTTHLATSAGIAAGTSAFEATARGDLGRAEAEQNRLTQLSHQLDTEIAATDQALATLCARFQIPKDFNVTAGQ